MSQSGAYDLDRICRLTKRVVTELKSGRQVLPEAFADEIRKANKSEKLDYDDLNHI